MDLSGSTAPRRVIVIGNLTIDDIVRADGTVAMASPGGNAVYATIAARLWNDTVGVVARRGEDLPPEIPEVLDGLAVDTEGLRTVGGPTVRNWVIYEENGLRRWLYRTPRERSAEVAAQPLDIPAGWLAGTPGPVVHIASMPLDAAARLVGHVRAQAPDALITLDTHEDWEGRAEDVLVLARRVDVFVPSREELTALVGYDDPARAVGELRGHGVPAVVAKLGADGALIDADGARMVRVGALPADAVDPTGAGDTFCGALAAALGTGLPLVEAVRRGAATAAWAVEEFGSLALARLDRAAAGERFAAAGPAPVTTYEPVPVEQPAAPERLTAPEDSPVSSAAPVTPSGDGGAISDTGATAPTGASIDTGGSSGPRTGDEPADGPAAVAPHDIDVMRREIEMVPVVIATRLSDPGGHVRRIAEELTRRGIEDIYLVGCGDSQFAGQAAALAFHRHTGVRAHAVHALDFARYQVRYLPEHSAVVCVSFSGRVGRTTEAAVQAVRFGATTIALTNNTDGELARAAELVLPVDVPTLGFSPGTSSYLGLLATLDDLALRWAQARGRDSGPGRKLLEAVPELAAATLRSAAGPAREAAGLLAAHHWITFLGGGPNEASARFGAAKLFEGPQLLGVSTNIEEWAHEEYFISGRGTPVLLIAPEGASTDRATEILSELDYIAARPLWVSDLTPRYPALHLPLAGGAPEEFSPLLAALPLSLIGFHLAELLGKESYNFPSEEARTEHYDTIHRIVIGEPA